MDISRIDYWAATGTSQLHRSSTPSKIAATALAISSVVVSNDLFVLAALYALVMLSVRAAGLPVLKVFGLSVFPALFAALFALSQARAGWALPATIILKAVTAASSMLLLVSTTPFNEVLAFMGRLLPRVVKDGLFMTYRSFFILLNMMDHFIDALKLRGGLRARGSFNNARHVAAGVGMLFIRAYDKSQRLYDVMTIRGYSGSLVGDGRRVGGFRATDVPYPLMAGLILLEAAYSRISGQPAHMAALVVALALYTAVMEASRFWKR